MNPRIGVAIVAHNQTQAGLRQVVDDARRAGAAVKSSAGEMARSTQGAAMHTANLGAQFNDIAVQLAQPGTSPFLIAMQQGTQIAQVIGPMGAGGAVKALGAAFTGLLNPVSLVTIGAIALGGSVVQWLASLNEESPKAEDRLKAHAEWLDEILVGYKDAQDAAGRYIDEAKKVPQGAILAEISGRQKGALAELDAAMESLIDKQFRIARGDQSGMGEFALQIREMQQGYADGLITLDELQLKLMAIRDDAALPSAMRKFAAEALAAIENIRAVEAQVRSLAAAAATVSFPAVPASYLSAQDTLAGLAAPVLNDREQALAALNEGLGGAQDEVQRIALRRQYDEALKRTATDEAAAAAKKAASASLGGGGRVGIPDIAAESLDRLNEQMEIANKQASDLAKTLSGYLTQAASSFFGAIVKGDDALAALRGTLGNIANELLNSSLSSFFSTLVGSFMPQQSWNIPDSFVPGGFYPGLPNAKGNVFSGPGIAAFSGSVVSSPTLFPFARGVGLMGEAGPEAILPLKRGSDGKLGVSAGGGGGVSIVVNNNSGAQVQARDAGLDGAGRRLIEIAVSEAEARVGANMAKGSYRSYGVGPGVKKS